MRWTPVPALFLLAFLARTARADERVPDVPDAALPVAMTCAPLAEEERTLVLVGTPADSSWFRVQGITGVLDGRGLEALLSQRSGVAPGSEGVSRHPVWIRVSGEHRWEHVVRVMLACLRAGIYRVGLVVRHPAAQGVYGFPLYLPGPLPGVSTPEGNATSVDVRVGTSLAQEAGGPQAAPSDPGRLYAAAQRLSEQYPGRVVAGLRVAHNAPVQYSLTCLDMLYRGGVAGVKLRFPMLKGSLNVAVRPWIMVESLMLDPEPLNVALPSVMPREEPWPDSGANVPGVLLMPTQDVPGGEAETRSSTGEDMEWPSHGAGGVPARVLQHAAVILANYAQGLGTALLRGLEGGPETVAYLAERLRPLDEFRQAMGPARAAFPDATSVTASALQVDVLLYREGLCVRHVEATLDISTNGLGFIFLRPGQGETGGFAPSPADDPTRSGVAGALRVFLESVLSDLGAQGTSAVTLRPAAAVKGQLPQAAHASVDGALGRRAEELQAVVAALRATPYDRVIVRPVSASAAVRVKDVIVGILSLGMTTEAGELRASAVTPRRVPR